MQTQKRFTVYVLSANGGELFFARYKQAVAFGDKLKQLNMEFEINKEFRFAEVNFMAKQVEANEETQTEVEA